MIGGAYQRTTFYLAEALSHAQFTIGSKLIGMYILLYGIVFVRRLQVLADSQYLAAYSPQVIHQLFHLSRRLAQSYHNTRLGNQSGFSHLMQYS